LSQRRRTAIRGARSKRWVNPGERAQKFFGPEGKIFLA
jgi:hypothetical protein